METFVDHHYAEQIARLDRTGEEGALRRLLETCQSEEVHHRDEAAAALGGAERGAAAARLGLRGRVGQRGGGRCGAAAMNPVQESCQESMTQEA